MEEQTTLVDEPMEYEVILDEEEEAEAKPIPCDWEDQLYEQARDKKMMKEEAEQ
jgi:hypothetical protein